MQFKLIPAILIFLGSYLPLAIILAIQDINNDWIETLFCKPNKAFSVECFSSPLVHSWSSLLFIALTTFAFVLTWVTLGKSTYPFKIEIKKAKAIPNEIINYTFPYVVSFMGISYADPQKLLGFFVFLAWMFTITFKSGQILMNPVLLAFKWRLYEATITINGVEKDVKILKKGELHPGPADAQTIQDFYIIKG